MDKSQNRAEKNKPNLYGEISHCLRPENEVGGWGVGRSRVLTGKGPKIILCNEEHFFTRLLQLQRYIHWSKLMELHPQKWVHCIIYKLYFNEVYFNILGRLLLLVMVKWLISTISLTKKTTTKYWVGGGMAQRHYSRAKWTIIVPIKDKEIQRSESDVWGPPAPHPCEAATLEEAKEKQSN